MPNVEPLREGDPAAVGPYRLVGRLGAGGHGVAYLGQARNGTPVAVKVLREGLTGNDRLAKEIAAARRVEPFCLAQVLDASTSGRPYIVAEYVDGPSLQESGRLGGAELQRLAVATATALDALHQAGVLHLDLKPANVVIGPDGARVVDFGIAGAFWSGVSATSNIVGTPAYMAPEQLAGKTAEAPADVFAWASVITFAATGVPPFGDDSLPAVINRILRETPRIGDLPRPLREVVAACLAKDPGARPTMRDVLLRLLGGERPPQTAAPRGPARLPDDDYATPPASGLRDRDAAAATAAYPRDPASSPAAHYGVAHDLGGHRAAASHPGAGQDGRTAHHDPGEAGAPHHGAGVNRLSASRQGPARLPLSATVPLSAPVETPPSATGHPAATGYPVTADYPAAGHLVAGHLAAGHAAAGHAAAERAFPGPQGERPGPAPDPNPSRMQHSALVDILVAGQPGTGGKKAAKGSGRRRVKTVLIAGVSGVSVLALAAAIVWLTPTTPTPKAETAAGSTGAPTSQAAPTPTRTPRPQRTSTVRPTPQAEGTPSIVPTTTTTPAAGTGRLQVALRPRGTANGDCWAGGEVTLRALVARTGGPLTFRYTWLIDGEPVGRSSATIPEDGRRYLTSPRTLTGTGGTTHRVTLRITAPVPVERSISVTLCDGF